MTINDHQYFNGGLRTKGLVHLIEHRDRDVAGGQQFGGQVQDREFDRVERTC